MKKALIPGAHIFYTDVDKLGAGYKAGNITKIVQSPYDSVQISESYVILIVLLDFTKPLNIITDFQHVERVY